MATSRKKKKAEEAPPAKAAPKPEEEYTLPAAQLVAIREFIEKAGALQNELGVLIRKIDPEALAKYAKTHPDSGIGLFHAFVAEPGIVKACGLGDGKQYFSHNGITIIGVSDITKIPPLLAPDYSLTGFVGGIQVLIDSVMKRVGPGAEVPLLDILFHLVDRIKTMRAVTNTLIASAMQQQQKQADEMLAKSIEEVNRAKGVLPS